MVSRILRARSRRVEALYPALLVGFVLGLPAALASQSATGKDQPPGELLPSLASVVLPGSGQLLRGERRGFAYLAAEGVVWALWLDGRRDGRDLRDRYRDLAWQVARGQPMPRVDGGFEYFERMIRWDRSGAYDLDPAAAGIQPETDPGTFNGDAWLLARSLFWSGAETPPTPQAEAAALEFYRERAYGPDLLWDWTGASSEKSRFVRLISDSDDAFRRARIAAGGLLLNRLLSLADIHLSSRVPGDARIRLIPITGSGASAPHLVVSWTLPSSLSSNEFQ